jgi:hypothetical protein
MTFVQRLINVSIVKVGSPFTDSGTNTLNLSGLRVSCQIMKAGGPSMSTMQMQIFGMTLSQMNDLSTLGMQIQTVPKNLITVTASDVGALLTTVFIGDIYNAYADFQASPEVSFNIEAHTLDASAAISAPVTSIQGSADVAGLMSNFGTQMGCTSFENNGVAAKLSNPYFHGSIREQALACVTAAGIAWNGGDNNVMAIWPKNGARNGSIPLVSPETGMVGYPSYIAQGLLLKTEFNPAITFGGKIQVQSSLTPACGTWAVVSLTYELDSLYPNGKWFSVIGAVNPQYAPTILGPVS